MSDDPVESAKKWLNTQGYPLEMEVAAALLEAGFTVNQSTYYMDPEGGGPRELDVRAWKLLMLRASQNTPRTELRRRRCLVALELAIQCKSAIAPWIAMRPLAGRSPVPSRWASGIYNYPTSEAGRVALEECESEIDDDLSCPAEQFAYGIVTQKREKGDKDFAFEATLTAMKASIAHCASARQAILSVPVVVTGSKLLTCQLRAGELHVEEVPECFVGLDYMIGDGSGSLVRVVAKDHLRAFAVAAAATFDNIATVIRENGDDILMGLQEIDERRGHEQSSQ